MFFFLQPKKNGDWAKRKLFIMANALVTYKRPLTENYKIGHNLKTLQVRDPIFFLDPCFQE